MSFDINPADEQQPTREEWLQFEVNSLAEKLKICKGKLAESEASAAQLAEANRKLAEVAKDREQVAEAERERIIQLHRDMIDASISRVEFKERYGVEFSSDFAGMVHSLGPALAIDEIQREARDTALVEAAKELCVNCSECGPPERYGDVWKHPRGMDALCHCYAHGIYELRAKAKEASHE